MGYSGSKFLIAVDCVIFGFNGEQLQLLLVKRNVYPEKGAWSLMGGFLDENEDLKSAAERVLITLTGLEDVYLDQVKMYGGKERDAGGRVLSTTYFALINSMNMKESLSKEFEASWFDINEIPDLIFDHELMVKDAREKLKEQAAIKPVGFNLLPIQFTLPQLQSLYEAIFDKQFDKRNFSKRLLSTGALLKQSDKDKSASKKGAYYYKFNPEKISKDFKFL